MLFKDLKQGYPVYFLSKGENISVSQGKVVSVSEPHFQQTSMGQMPLPMQTAQRMVDVTVDLDGKNNTYSIPETLSVTYGQDFVLSTDRDGIIRDVEAMRNQSQEALKNVERHKKIIESCDKIMESWDPDLAKRKEQDKRMSKIEDDMGQIKEMVLNLFNELKK